MNRRIFAVVSFSLLTLVVLTTAQQKEKVHLKAGIIPVPEHSKLIIARDKGFFALEGLDVELVEFANSADGIAALRGGKIDAGSVGITAPLVHISKDAKNIRLIGGLGGEGSAVVIRPDLAEKITDLKGLKGLKIGTVRLSSSDAIVRSELAKAGIDWKKDIQIFELKSPAAVLESVRSKEVDAGVVWAPFDIKAEELGLKVFVRTGKLLPGHPCCRIAVLSEELAKRPAVWVSYLRAILNAEQYIEKNRNESITAVTQALKIDQKLVNKVLSDGNTEFSSDPNVSGTVLFWNSMKQSGFVTSEQDIKSYIAVAPFKAALDGLIKDHPEDAYWKAKLIQFTSRN